MQCGACLQQASTIFTNPALAVVSGILNTYVGSPSNTDCKTSPAPQPLQLSASHLITLLLPLNTGQRTVIVQTSGRVASAGLLTLPGPLWCTGY